MPQRARPWSSISLHPIISRTGCDWVTPEKDLEHGGSDRLIDALVVYGTETQIRERVQQHFDAGATQVILNTIRLLPPDETPKILAAGVNYQSISDWQAFETLKPR